MRAWSRISLASDRAVAATLIGFSTLDVDRSLQELLAADRLLAAVFRVETLVSMAIQREWAVNLRRRVALEPVAHLLCEVFERLRAVGLLECGKSCGFPITQMDLAGVACK